MAKPEPKPIYCIAHVGGVGKWVIEIYRGARGESHEYFDSAAEAALNLAAKLGLKTNYCPSARSGPRQIDTRWGWASRHFRHAPCMENSRA